MEIFAGEQGLSLQQLKIQTIIKSHFKLGHFDVFYLLFLFLTILKLQPIIL